MGRGRQKAKQQKIARKLKYLTTDTDYDELAKELSEQEPGTGSVDPFADVEDQYVDTDEKSSDSAAAPVADDDLDEYAKWAAEAAAKATSGEFPKTAAKPAVPHKPIPMPKPRPIPSALKPKQ
ncbi:hypothetical protein BISA_0985 [Bifidobacterium saguini DSM 23967]|uniref:DUF3073 domain-containing protein n=3 Tax=Bifidobacterium TaxID=1678 RepID=A0A2N5IPY9_9BIFI|nr:MULTISPECIES: DUF3073 domain-containing protein [Bifidobacterium]KFI91698.1 hypothetical protein BISA_0985 [Bifidobacterium saguini DSM 23967]PLS24027.1 hypothetical protein Tam1G_1916 [Bifidobacterium imperatoris]QSY58384.1 DUF3073 domain-containing protein [Bifidobacterium imperatoris]QTB91914.1 DUF3073 domain-containing protein [Bifidobacterium saguini]